MLLTSSVTHAGTGSSGGGDQRDRIPDRSVDGRTAPTTETGRLPSPRRARRAPRVPPGGGRVRTASSGSASAHFRGHRATGIERLVARYDLDNEEALAHLERRLRGIGVIRALEAQGFEPGDDVRDRGR